MLKMGKLLFVSDLYLIVAKGYDLYKYDLITMQENYYTSIIDRKLYSILSRNDLSRRLFRAEITSYAILEETEFCIAKKGIFRKKRNEANFTKVREIKRGSRPLNLAIDRGTLFYGEYFANPQKEEVHIYKSDDCGDRWVVAYTFAKGEINHIHGIFKDSYSDKVWVVTGDLDNETMIAYTEDHFASLRIVFRGGQDVRTCTLFFYPTFIVFATDTPRMTNYIKTFDRDTLLMTDICPIQGSVIKGGQVGNVSFFSTAVEDSDVNMDNYAHIWISVDGENWENIQSVSKDCYHRIWFQYGTFEFPTYQIDGKLDTLYFTGKALNKYDNKMNKYVICK